MRRITDLFKFVRCLKYLFFSLFDSVIDILRGRVVQKKCTLQTISIIINANNELMSFRIRCTPTIVPAR